MGPTRSTRQFFAAAASQARSAGKTCADSLEKKRTHQLVLVVTVALVIGILVVHNAFGVHTARQKWASLRPVVIATRLIRAGDEITEDNTSRVTLPEAITAADALRVVTPGSRAVITLTERTPITESMVDATSTRPAIPPGWRGVALPADLVAPTVVAGDRVDIVAAGSIVTTDALVLSVATDGQLTVAVPTDAAATVATAARLGEVSLILSS